MTAGPSQQDVLTFRAAHAIAKLVHDRIALNRTKFPDLRIQDKRQGGVNPRGIQTASGLYLVATDPTLK